MLIGTGLRVSGIERPPGCGRSTASRCFKWLGRPTRQGFDGRILVGPDGRSRVPKGFADDLRPGSAGVAGESRVCRVDPIWLILLHDDVPQRAASAPTSDSIAGEMKRERRILCRDRMWAGTVKAVMSDDVVAEFEGGERLGGTGSAVAVSDRLG